MTSTCTNFQVSVIYNKTTNEFSPLVLTSCADHDKSVFTQFLKGSDPQDRDNYVYYRVGTFDSARKELTGSPAEEIYSSLDSRFSKPAGGQNV